MSAQGASTLRTLSLISFFYDVSVGIAMSGGRGLLIDWFGVAAPQPPIHADLNAVFVTTVGIGYLLPYRDPARYRAYLWLMGPLLKGVGALVFVLDYLLRGSPRSFLLFAASDGALALVTLVALVRTTNRSAGRAR
ncbi:MAG: hypothetical protein ACRD2A_01830 [Vicinamibacterales bacterium]